MWGSTQLQQSSPWILKDSLLSLFIFYFLAFSTLDPVINDQVWVPGGLHQPLGWLLMPPLPVGTVWGELGRMGRILPLLGSFTPLQHPGNHLQVQWRKPHRACVRVTRARGAGDGGGAASSLRADERRRRQREREREGAGKGGGICVGASAVSDMRNSGGSNTALRFRLG